MAIGNLGSLITFEVSDKKVLQFNDMERKASGRWASFDRYGKKPLKQFLGPDAQELSMEIVLDARHGVKPRTTMTNIRNAVEKGTAYYLVIKGSKVSGNKFVITKMSESWDEIYNKGELVRASVELTLEEYL